jgi:hypothetical protein
MTNGHILQILLLLQWFYVDTNALQLTHLYYTYYYKYMNHGITIMMGSLKRTRQFQHGEILHQ